MKVNWRQFTIIFLSIFIVINVVSTTARETYSQTLIELNANTILETIDVVAKEQECSSDDFLRDNKLCPSNLGEKKPIQFKFPTQPSPTTNKEDRQRFFRAIAFHLPIASLKNSLDYILLKSYGSAFVNKQPGIKLPKKVVFKNHQETENFQDTLVKGTVKGTGSCTLQKPAAEALNKARSQVRIPLKSGYTHSDCMRTYALTDRFWRKYADSRTLDLVRQGKERKILGIVAPPGSSQHLWGLAIDLRVSNKAQVKALNDNGWYRTVENDTPHWTYLGQPISRLEELGFQRKVVRSVTYWLTPL